MATFEPEPALFATQIESLRRQTDTEWVCVVSDDCSGPEHVAAIERVLDGDPRFVLARGDRRLGFYRNFERAIGLAPPEAELIALCDQDDRWQPDKLAVLRDALGGAGLVFSDQRLVDAGGQRAPQHDVGGPAQQPLGPRLAARRQQRHGGRDAVPPRDRPARAAVPGLARAPVPRPLDRARRARGGRRRVRGPAALRLRPASGRGLRRGVVPAAGARSGACSEAAAAPTSSGTSRASCRRRRWSPAAASA